MKILITGVAGFIGYHLSSRVLKEGYTVIGIDNMNNYYDVNLKKDRLNLLKDKKNFKFHKIDIRNMIELNKLFIEYKPKVVINLAAQAGVRYSIENPHAYLDSNVFGFLNILEACKDNNVEHLIYASSSSVYGGNKKVPFLTNHNVDHPVSLYAATKKSNELMAHTYSHLYGLPTTGLRFFTVYGPYGRPDMAYFTFTKDIIERNPIKVFNYGKMERDFTYIDDIVEGVVKLIPRAPKPKKEWDENKDALSESFAPYKLYNIGNNNPVKLKKFINIIEDILGIDAKKDYVPMQPGDVLQTYADITDLERDIGFSPKTDIEEGLKKFIDWYLVYYKIKKENR